MINVIKSNKWRHVCFSLDIFRYLNVKLCQPLQAPSWACISFPLQSSGLPSAKRFYSFHLGSVLTQALLNHFKMPRADKQALAWECMFLWSQLCIFTLLFILECVCVCVFKSRYRGIGGAHYCSAECCDCVWSLESQRLCLYAEVKDSLSVTSAELQAVILTAPFISHKSSSSESLMFVCNTVV